VKARDVEEKLSHCRKRVITLRELHQMHVAVIDRIAEIREIIFTASLTLSLTRQLQKKGCLADEIERDVRERDVLLENRTMPAPLRETMTEHESIVAKSEEVLKEVVGQNPLRPRGIL
jgi:hypothetical protein